MRATPIVPGALYHCRWRCFASIIPARNGIHALEVFINALPITFVGD